MRHNVGKAARKLLGALLTLSLALQPVWGASAMSLDSVKVVSAPLARALASLNGMVRVYLSSLGNPTSLSLTIAGSYSLADGTSLSNGETLTVGFSSTTGSITLTRNGTRMNMGTYFTLRRHTATGTNGIKIAQARKPNNPYPGDLSFRSVKQSSGSYKLYTVAHVYIENYLYGVVPYEMGSSAPLEALKAQAVAARTYTVRMMNNRSGGYYDVVDTTGDQTYNGMPTGCDSCVKAVDSTKGIVVQNNGSYTATYYSTCNGGQTESILNVWGTSGYSYLNVHDDPFDYNNPDSIVKSTPLYADCGSASNKASLMALLKTKAVSALVSAGYAATSSNTTLITIKSAAAHTPKYASPSRLYTKLDVTLTASTKSSSGSLVNATVTVTCDIFGELENLLSMSIQSGQNELWSVTKSNGNFLLEARRYGHGLGMSQRGAMYMGKLGYTYDAILGFYYPGCVRVSTTFTNTILAAGSSEEISNDEPATEIVDPDNTGACTAVVTLVSSGGKLAIRSTKSTSGSLLGVAPNSSPVTVLASDGTWCLIKFGAIVGYVPLNALTVSGTPPTSSDQSVTSILGFGKVTASGTLNLRASGSSSAAVVTVAPGGAILTVFDKTSDWAHIQYGAAVAYASTAYLSISDTYPDAVASTGSTSATVSANGGVAYLRATASTSGTVLAQLPDGATVTVTHDDGSWANVTYNGQTGYMLSSSLVYGEDTGSNSGGSGDTGTSTGSETAATVSADIAYLRSAAEESASVVAEIAKGQQLVVTQRGDTWCAARYNESVGYVLTASLSFGTPTSTLTATVATQSGSLNIRSAASAGSTILTTIPKGATVTVNDRGATWCGVTYGGYTGYVMTTFLSFSDSAPSGDQTVNTTATVTTVSGSLNLREQPKTGSRILTTVPRQTVVTVHTKGTQWCNITYNNVTGYVMTVFLTFATGDGTSPSTGSGNDTLSSSQTATVTLGSGTLNLRADASTSSHVLARIPNGTILTVLEKQALWTKTSYGSYNGYVMNTYLIFSTVDTSFPDSTSTDASTDNDSNDNDSTGSVSSDSGSTDNDSTDTNHSDNDSSNPDSTNPDATDSPAVVTATVNTASGSLNLRQSASSSAAIIARIPRLATVTVLEKGDPWCQVTYLTTTGYVMTTYLQFSDSSSQGTSGQTTDTQTVPLSTTVPDAGNVTQTLTTAWVVTASGSLNLRTTASADAALVTEIPRLAKVQVVEQSGDWSNVVYGAYVGYVQSQYLTATQPTDLTTDNQDESTPNGSASDSSGELPDSLSTVGTSTVTEDPTLTVPDAKLSAAITPPQGETTLALYAQCSEQSQRLLNMLANAQVEVLRKGDIWCEILYFDQKGFCRNEGLTLLD